MRILNSVEDIIEFLKDNGFPLAEMNTGEILECLHENVHKDDAIYILSLIIKERVDKDGCICEGST